MFFPLPLSHTGFMHKPAASQGGTSHALISLCAAVDLTAGDDAPEWVHLLPSGIVRTHDGRGPYRVADAVALMAASLKAGEKLVIDENHSTDLAAPKGLSAPARGWVVELQQRSDGIWGRVEWTGEGRRMVADGSYRGISPAIAHRKDGTITAILRAGLVNKPNLSGLTALHQEDNHMNLKEMLIEALGLDAAADDDAIVAAVKKKMAGDVPEAALQAALSPIAQAAGLAIDADAATVLAGVQQLASAKAGAADNKVVVALQAELADVTTKLNALTENTAKKAAETFVDAAIAEGRVGVKPMRDEYVAMHMEDATRAEKLIKAMPAIGGKGGRTSATAPEGNGKDGGLSDADRQVIALMGVDPEEYKKTRAAEAGDDEELL
jgi:phage I-like protein